MNVSDTLYAPLRQDTTARGRVLSPTMLLAVGLASAALLAAGCGSGSSATTHGQTRTSRPAKRAHRRPSGVGVGATQRVHAGVETLSVSVFKVINPLHDSGATLLPDSERWGW